MAPSLRGAAIVGYYNEAKEDFEERTGQKVVTDENYLPPKKKQVEPVVPAVEKAVEKAVEQLTK